MRLHFVNSLDRGAVGRGIDYSSAALIVFLSLSLDAGAILFFVCLFVCLFVYWLVGWFRSAADDSTLNAEDLDHLDHLDHFWDGAGGISAERSVAAASLGVEPINLMTPCPVSFALRLRANNRSNCDPRTGIPRTRGRGEGRRGLGNGKKWAKSETNEWINQRIDEWMNEWMR